MVNLETFGKIQRRLLHHLIKEDSILGFLPNVTEHISPHATSERQIPDTALDPRCQSGPSARNSFVPNERRFPKDYGADQQLLQISDLHFDKFPTRATFACWKTRFKTEVRTCSQFLTEAVLRIREVDDLKSSRCIRGTHGPNIELLDARIASALNKIIQNTRFKKMVSVEEMKAQKRRPLPPRKTDCSLDLRLLPGYWRSWYRS